MHWKILGLDGLPENRYCLVTTSKTQTIWLYENHGYHDHLSSAGNGEADEKDLKAGESHSVRVVA
jgi:hypothetical protein